MNFRKFKNLRIDLDEVLAYDTSLSHTRESGYYDSIIFYPKSGRHEYFSVRYYTAKDEAQMKEDLQVLDDHFSIKSDEENKLLP